MLLFAPGARAQPTPIKVDAQPQLRGMTAEEKVANAQAKLKNEEQVVFDLLSGAPAFYSMTRTTPREAFLRLPLAKTFSIERKATHNRLWQPYRIIVLPDGPGKLLFTLRCRSRAGH